MLLALFAVGLAQASTPSFRLPEGSAAERTSAALRGGLEGRRVPAPDPATAAGWQLWMGELAQAKTAQEFSAEREARLCLFALAQGRYECAWKHYAQTSGDPRVSAALLPRLLPGISAADPLATDGLAGALSNEIRLFPAVPPLSGPLLPGRVQRREMSVEGLKVGEARVRMVVRVEYEGVIVELLHQAGPACVVHVAIPLDPDYAFGAEYLDWYQQEQSGQAHRVELTPGAEARTLYGRFEWRAQDFPRRLPQSLPALARLDGLRLEWSADGAELEFARGLAQALALPPLGLDTSVFLRGEKQPKGMVIDLSQPAQRPRRLRELAHAIESFVLPR